MRPLKNSESISVCYENDNADWYCNKVSVSYEHSYTRSRSRVGHTPYSPEDAEEVLIARIKETDRERAARFASLAETWREETWYLSLDAQKIAHPAYQSIIQMGRPIVPLLLCEMEIKPTFWFAALQEITGEKPDLNAESFDEAVAAWLDWGRKRGIIE